jgi:glycosyltransferase involved in cell wall biosynthesis
MATVSIIVPVYNEAQTIERVIEMVRSVLLPNYVQREIVVVDDGSVDGTAQILKRFQSFPEVKIIQLHHNRGKGEAIRAGIPECRGDWILIQDGDMEYDPSAYSTILEPLLKGEAQVVYGSRFLGTIEKMGWSYWICNKLLVLWTNLLYGTSITDEATAYKAFAAPLLARLTLTCRRFEFCPEVTGKLSRMKIPIHEVPIVYRGRDKGQGKKIRWTDAFVAFWILFRERVRK